ncbi:hypothetical protein FA13DRAFT_1731349 [Coprinellus micaceus]|uniref:WW domain-containing protein n=1 Tax=Coprinellus micaceus TaxID=71717 RepID=A0A4Y7TFS7_COPMI|nr:hypothetical protein FA13DRAFT_1731349 [Coprinellus micaceus]
MSSKSSPSISREHTPVPVAEGSKKSTKATVEDVAEEQDTANPEPSPETEPKTEEQPAEATSHGWQAIFSPQHGAYYFYNSTTQETTWVNPLQPEASSSASTSAPAADPSSSSNPPDAEASEVASSSKADTSTTTAPTSHYAALQAAAVAQGIDPALAHLDPSLLGAIPGQQTDASGIPLFTAKFNRHTGAFARVDARDPSHLSEHERAKRMSQFYFDVDQWQDDLAKHGGSIKGPAGAGASEEWEDDGEGGRKRKRPTKKDMEMYKEKKKQKKLAKTAWLRN